MTPTFSFPGASPALLAYLAVDKDDPNRRALFKDIDPVEWCAYRHAHKTWYCRPETETSRSEHLSPSGRYRLVVTSHSTGKGTWNYTKGIVYEKQEPIATVYRNYSTFWFTFIEDHASTGTDWFLCGESYMGQTFVNLRTGQVYRDADPEAHKGMEFCWTSAELLRDGVTLQVEGCHWACPYETKFFDFSNPAEGWPGLEFPEDEDYVDLDPGSGTLSVQEDGSFLYTSGEKVYRPTGERKSEIERRYSALRQGKTEEEKKTIFEQEEAEIDEEDESKWTLVTDRKVTFRREGKGLVKISEWKSDSLLEQERVRAERDAEWRRKKQHWEETDPLYHSLQARSRIMDQHYWIPSMVMRDQGDTNGAYFHVTVRKVNKYCVYFEWGADQGPITGMREFTYSNQEKKTFDRDTPVEALLAWADADVACTCDHKRTVSGNMCMDCRLPVRLGAS